MNGREPTPPPNSHLADQLLAYDAALDGGNAPGAVSSDSLPSALRDGLSCLKMLERVRQGDAREPPPGEPTIDKPRRSAPDTAVGEPGNVTQDDLSAPSRFGRFEILRILGQGGCGVVFLARDPVLDRLIALKIPRPERLLKAEMRQRFLREGRAAGCLNHPHLLTVFEAGEVGAICYLAAPYCHGLTLSEWRRQHPAPLAPRAAAGLIATLADAMHYAHQKGICHRDLKPSNILLTSEPPTAVDDVLDAVPKIIDFGLAKILDETCGETVTGTGAVMGTPQYMAPEQAEGKTQTIGPATDIHALGLILYELLTGVSPYKGDTDLDTLQKVIDREPPRPSRICSRVPRDLETICLKCLAKAPAQRYASMEDLANDLHAFLDGRPIQARPIGRAARAVKWLWRRPRTLTAIGVLLLAVVAVGIAAGIRESTHRAEVQRALLEASRHKARADEWDWRVRNQHYATQIRAGGLLSKTGQWAALREVLLAQQPAGGEKDLRGFEWHYLWHAAQRGPALGDRAGKNLLDQQSHSLPGPARISEAWCLAFTPDGKTLAVGYDHEDLFPQTLRLWDRATRQAQAPAGHYATVMALAVSPDGRTLATASFDGTVRLWDPASGACRGILRGHSGPVRALAFSPDGGKIASAGTGKFIKIWNATSGAPEASWHAHADMVRSLAFSSDGKVLISVANDDRIKLWNTDDWSLRGEVANEAHVQCVACPPDRMWLATGNESNRVEIWHIGDGRPVKSMPGHLGKVRTVAFSPDGKTLASGGEDKTVRLWNALTGDELLVLPTEHFVNGLAFDARSKTLAAALHDGTVKVWAAE